MNTASDPSERVPSTTDRTTTGGGRGAGLSIARHSYRRIVVLSASLLLAPLTPVVAAAGTPSAAPVNASSSSVGGCPSNGWRTIRLPGEPASLANDVATVNGTPTWVVGNHAGRGRMRTPWIVRRTSHGWQTVKAAYPGTDSGLVGISMRAPSDGWAVGYRADGRLLRPISEHWDGSRWTTSSVPLPGYRSATLVDVAASADAATWAVGYRTTSRGPRPFAVDRLRGRWVRRDPGLARGTYGALVAVASKSSRDAWSVGWQTDGLAISAAAGALGRLALAARDGRGRPERRKRPHGRIVRGAGDVWVVGYRLSGARYLPIVEHFDGSRWSAVDGPSDPRLSLLSTGLAVDSAGQVIISGMSRTAGGGFVATIVRQTASGWAIVQSPGAARAPSIVRAVAWGRVGAIAVGWGGPSALGVGTCRPWSSLPTGAEVGLPGIPAPTASIPVISPDRAPVAAGSDTVVASSGAGVTFGGIHYRDVAREVGLAGTTITYGATRLDLNADGWPDLLISHHTDKALLMRNQHGTFVEAAAGPLPAHDRHGCAAADVNGDGRDDIFCAIGAARGAKFKSDELWTDLDTRQARNIAISLGIDDPVGRGRRATFLKLDGDRLPDLFVTNDPVRVDGLPSVNRLFRNTPGAGFVAAPELGLDLPMGGDCAVSADLDGDGQPEVIVCADEAWGGGPGLHVFSRLHGRFQDVTSALGLSPHGDIDALVTDLDRDGQPDIVQLAAGRLEVHLQRHGRFELAYSQRLSGGKAVAAGDANGDGKMDLFVVQAGHDRLLLNSGTGRSFTSLDMPYSGGSPDDVVTIDHDRNGLDDFLVLNGAAFAGPVQLIAGFR